jgi:hypothetical protein
MNDGSTTYANAYFEINYINVYSTSASANNTSTLGATSASMTTTISAGASSAAAAVSSRSAAQRQFSVGGARGWKWAVSGSVAIIGGVIARTMV